jgi:hypothetical protein
VRVAIHPAGCWQGLKTNSARCDLLPSAPGHLDGCFYLIIAGSFQAYGLIISRSASDFPKNVA